MLCVASCPKPVKSRVGEYQHFVSNQDSSKDRQGIQTLTKPSVQHFTYLSLQAETTGFVTVALLTLHDTQETHIFDVLTVTSLVLSLLQQPSTALIVMLHTMTAARPSRLCLDHGLNACVSAARFVTLMRWQASCPTRLRAVKRLLPMALAMAQNTSCVHTSANTGGFCPRRPVSLSRVSVAAMLAPQQHANGLMHGNVSWQEKASYMRELEELIPQMENLIQDKATLEEQVALLPLLHAVCVSALCLHICC